MAFEELADDQSFNRERLDRPRHGWVIESTSIALPPQQLHQRPQPRGDQICGRQ